MVNTHTAAGRMVLMNLANYRQFEREMIERTRDALQHMKAQGFARAGAPRLATQGIQPDQHGRRAAGAVEASKPIAKMVTLQRGPEADAKWRRLNEEQGARATGGLWRVNGVR